MINSVLLASSAPLRTAIILYPVLGLSWISGFLIFGDDPTYIQVVEWIFFVLVTLQGAVIFFMNCIVNKEVCTAVAIWFPHLTPFCVWLLITISVHKCLKLYCYHHNATLFLWIKHRNNWTTLYSTKLSELYSFCGGQRALIFLEKTAERSVIFKPSQT